MKRIILSLTALSAMLLIFSCDAQSQKKNTDVRKVKLIAPKGKAIAAFAEGCFWCSEHIYDEVIGVDSAVSGYAGGKKSNPTYEEVSSETTGHAETVLVYYNPKIVSYTELLNVFFTSHDPTTLNKQGPDEGSSYRSVIFYSSETEKTASMQAIRDVSKSGKFKKPIVTELKPLTKFYPAEDHHQKFIKFNPANPYVRGVSIPRFENFKKTYKGKLKN